MRGLQAGEKETARGDRARRRRDVLGAAAAILDESGWEGFSIRDIAARAGVSGGAVYQWFSGKGEIWARLQTARFESDAATADSWSSDVEPSEIVNRLVLLIAHNHVDLGRHRFEFVRALPDQVPDYAVELAAAYERLNSVIGLRVVSLYGNEGVPVNLAARISWLWAVGRGVGDHMVDSHLTVRGVAETDFLDTAAECVLAGLRAPSPTSVGRPSGTTASKERHD